MKLSINLFFILSLSFFVLLTQDLMASRDDIHDTEIAVQKLIKISAIFDRKNEEFWPPIESSNPDEKVIKKWVSSINKIVFLNDSSQMEVDKQRANSFYHARMQELVPFTNQGWIFIEELFEASPSSFYQFLALRSEYYRGHTLPSTCPGLLKLWRPLLGGFYKQLGEAKCSIEEAFRSDIASILSKQNPFEEFLFIFRAGTALMKAESHEQAAVRFLRAARHPENRSPNSLRDMCGLQIYFNLWSLLPNKLYKQKEIKDGILKKFQEASQYFWENKNDMKNVEVLYKACVSFYGETLLDDLMEQSLKRGVEIKNEFDEALGSMKKEQDFLFTQVTKRNLAQLEGLKQAFIDKYGEETLLGKMNQIEEKNIALNNSSYQDRMLCELNIKRDKMKFALLEDVAALKAHASAEKVHCKGAGLLPLSSSEKISNSISVVNIFKDDSDEESENETEQNEVWNTKEGLDDLMSPRTVEDYNEWIEAGFSLVILDIKGWLNTLEIIRNRLERHYTEMADIALTLEGYNKRVGEAKDAKDAKNAQNVQEGNQSTEKQQSSLAQRIQGSEREIHPSGDPMSPYDYPWFFLVKQKLSEVHKLPYCTFIAETL